MERKSVNMIALAPPPSAPRGQPSLYKPVYDQQVLNMRLLGLTLTEIAKVFCVSESSVEQWRHDHPTFSSSWDEGSLTADGKVARAMYKRAVGFPVMKHKVYLDKSGEEVKISWEEDQIPDFQAAAFWLTNRQRARWRTPNNAANYVDDNGDGTLPPVIIIQAVAAPAKSTP